MIGHGDFLQADLESKLGQLDYASSYGQITSDQSAVTDYPEYLAQHNVHVVPNNDYLDQYNAQFYMPYYMSHNIASHQTAQ